MKVLQSGREQRGWSKEVVCTGRGNGGGGCGARLLVETPDLYLTHRYDYGGGHDVFTTFTCASCGVETDLENCPVHGLPDKKDWAARVAAAPQGSGKP